ncbi:FAD-dependent monooxygenase [Corallococcus exercitus]|uniref:FAD-dependent monooxygenase n=1 Tax=Corallococcus exercitus TaxID=2316736 RepID=A0A3A8HMJ5_9BACT|nr:NAD(P)/FAD-dependent oxidoreductase [Corallococcus exercitus]NOK34591.1 FAD-dependent monooxygenase [Corallococcus exercitus]RKG72437.1 FAD-dependent monooxygenase [Corallococcus exercitus]
MSQGSVRRVVIIGAGIGGPVLGLWLRRIGMEVVLCEARASTAPGEGAFLGVAPNGMNVLAGLGLDTVVAARGGACERFRFTNAQGRVLGHIERGEDLMRYGQALTMVRRGELHAVLCEAAERAGVVVRFGRQLVEVDCSRPERVVARFSDGGEVEGDLLVGCDGLRSRVRAQVMPDAPAPRFAGFIDCGGFARLEGVPLAPGINEMVFGRRAFFGAFLTPEGETWWFHNGPPSSEAQVGADPERVREHLLALHGEDPAWVRDVIRATPKVLGPWPIFEMAGLQRWSEGRVCLLGDAAHAMPPSAGQGASLAMEDAMVLAQCLRDVADPLQALRTYERLRRPRVADILQQARRGGNGKVPESAFSMWLRDLILPLALRFGGATQSRSYAYRNDWARKVA